MPNKSGNELKRNNEDFFYKDNLDDEIKKKNKYYSNLLGRELGKDRV